MNDKGLSANELVALSAILAISLADGKTSEEILVLGNLFTATAELLFLIERKMYNSEAAPEEIII